MTPEIKTPETDNAVAAIREPWVTPEIASFDAVTVTQATGVLLGDFLNSLS